MSLKPHINIDYPPNNTLIFEEWIGEVWPVQCKTDRELIPFYPTSYWVNNNYGQDTAAKKQAQNFIDSLPRDRKYWICCQYDDGCLVDFKDLDVLQFNMSKKIGVEMPLLCQPHPYHFTGGKKIFASFVGSRTHPVRDELNNLKKFDGYYISFEPHNIEDYCRILHESMFALCPRGYGINSFRIAEAMQYGAIPVYISDEFIDPYEYDISLYGVKVHSSDVHRIDEILRKIPIENVIRMQDDLQTWYEELYSYEANLQEIILALEREFSVRQYP